MTVPRRDVAAECAGCPRPRVISKTMAPYKRTPMQQYMDRLSHGLIPPGSIEPNAIQTGTSVKPTTVRQNGHTYQRQPDGSMKAIN